MSTAVITLVVIVTFFSLMLLGLPVAFCLIGSAVIFTFAFWSPTALYMAATTIYAQSTNDIFLAIPLFVYLAAILEQSGIAEGLYDMFYKWLGRLRGGLAIGSVFMCTIMDAISGLGATGIVTIGPIAMPEMFKRNYDKKMAIGCIAAGSALGPLIPPSVIMIIIAGFTGLSVGKLFAGGLFPGLLCSAGFCLYIGIKCALVPQMGPAVAHERPISWAEKLKSLRGVILPVLLIAAVMGTIYTGICTPTEGAGVGAMGALVCAGINRKLTWKTVFGGGKLSIRITCMVMWLLIGGSMFASLLNALGIQQALGNALVGIEHNFGSPTLLAVIMGIIFVMGMFIDGAAITVLTMPVLSPVIQQANIDLLWFGILFTINIVIGYLTPPFGMNLFYTRGVAPSGIRMADIYESIIPYVVIMMVVLVIVILIPEIATWLPNKIIVTK